MGWGLKLLKLLCPARRAETSGKLKESTCEADSGVRLDEVLLLLITIIAGEDGAEDVHEEVLDDESVPPLNDCCDDITLMVGL